jgi:hypothetical protein
MEHDDIVFANRSDELTTTLRPFLRVGSIDSPETTTVLKLKKAKMEMASITISRIPNPVIALFFPFLIAYFKCDGARQAVSCPLYSAVGLDPWRYCLRA